MAYLSLEAETCPRCRTRAEEWDPARGGSRHAYYADADRCHGCETLEQAQREMRASGGDDELGVSLVLVPNDDDEDA